LRSRAGDAHEGVNPAFAAEGYHGVVLYGIESNESTLVTVAPETGALTTVDLSFNVYLSLRPGGPRERWRGWRTRRSGAR
jgi:hypothetical protein